MRKSYAITKHITEYDFPEPLSSLVEYAELAGWITRYLWRLPGFPEYSAMLMLFQKPSESQQ